MVHDVRFVWGLVEGYQYVGHLIDLGDPLNKDQTYCSKPISKLIDKKFTKGAIEKPDHSVCVACMKRNKEVLAERFNIKEWAH